MPNDKIEEITHALEIGEKFDEHYAVHNSQVRHLLQLVEQQQAEIERKDKFVAEWISGEDKFNEFGGWERIEKMQREVERLKDEYADERQSHNEHVTEMLETEQDLLRARAVIQQSREENERLRGELEREASDAAYWKSEYERSKSAVFKWGKECDRAKVHNEPLLLDIKLTKAELRSVENLGLKYQGELKKYRTPRPLEDWHEDYGDVLWWTLPIEEPPYCGSPLGSDWPGYHTHWTPIIEPIYEKGERNDG